ncbi:MAG: glycosyltransferase [Christensenellaceae bacterium]
MKTLIITNIASPYRVDFFDYLIRTYPEYGFRVLYTSDKQEGREWSLQEEKLHDALFLRSRSLTLGKKGWERTIYFPANPQRTISEVSPDVVIAMEYNPAALAALSWCKRRKVPFIHWTDGTLVNERKLNVVQKWARRRIVSSADAFIASSSAAKHKLEVYGAKGEIFVSFLTVDIDRYLVEKTSAGSSALITVGGLIERKGVDLLIRAVARLQGTKLIVVGNGPERETLEALARECGVDAEFTGFLEGEALRNAYARADAFVLATREDCFGLVLLEAMCASLPVISSKYADGAYDLIDDNGAIADPFCEEEFAEAIARVLSENGADNVLGRRSYERAREFAFAKVALPYLAAVDSVRRDQ